MKIHVDTSPSLTTFIKVNVLMNEGYPNYIRPLDKDIKAVFDPKKNKYFRSGKVCRWILMDDDDNLIGRIAAFVNPKYKNKGDKLTIGGIGFFDCINDQEAANLLLNNAKKWLEYEGMEAMDGPINFGERDRWWGLLVEGFQPPPYMLNYNPPYYKSLFENYGFKVFYNQVCWNMKLSENSQLSPKFYKGHKLFADNSDYEARHYKKNQLKKFAQDFCTVYNGAWAIHEGNKAMALPLAIKLFKSMQPIIDEKLVWFVYYRDQPVAMWLNLPDINQIVKHLDGQFNLIAKIKFMILKRQKVCNKMVGIVFGIVPEHQGTGIDYFMIVEGEKVIKSDTKYRDLELQWQGDFNPKILNISKNLEAEKARTLITYRYNFDESIPVERHPIL